jgi:hypothetical protein
LKKNVSVPERLRDYFKLFIDKSIKRAKEQGWDTLYDRDDAILNAAKLFEVSPEIAAKCFAQIEDAAREEALRRHKDVAPVSDFEEEEDWTEHEPTNAEIARARRQVRTGEAKDGPATATDINQPALKGEEKPEGEDSELADDQTVEPVDFKKKAPGDEQDTMTKIPDKELGGPNQQLYDGLHNHLMEGNLTPNFSEQKIEEKEIKSVEEFEEFAKGTKWATRKRGGSLIDHYLKKGYKLSVSTVAGKKFATLTDPKGGKRTWDENDNLVEEEPVTERGELGDIRKKETDADEWNAKAEEGEMTVGEAKDEEEGEKVKKSDTDADEWNEKAERGNLKTKTERAELYVCNDCTKTFRSVESKCGHCQSEKVEKIIDGGGLSEEQVEGVLGGLQEDGCDDEYEKMFQKERSEHPDLPEDAIHQIVKDHIRESEEEESSEGKYGVILTGADIGQKKRTPKWFNTKEEADEYQKRMNKQISKGEKGYYKLRYKKVGEDVEETVVAERAFGSLSDEELEKLKKQIDNIGESGLSVENLRKEIDDELSKRKERVAVTDSKIDESDLASDLATNESFVKWWMERKNAIKESDRTWDFGDFDEQMAQNYIRNFQSEETLNEEYNVYNQEKEGLTEQEKDSYRTIARGFEDRRDAETLAREKRGTVVVDDLDEKKFMIIVKE